MCRIDCGRGTHRPTAVAEKNGGRSVTVFLQVIYCTGRRRGGQMEGETQPVLCSSANILGPGCEGRPGGRVPFLRHARGLCRPAVAPWRIRVVRMDLRGGWIQDVFWRWNGQDLLMDYTQESVD